jgi:hypothetical protein
MGLQGAWDAQTPELNFTDAKKQELHPFHHCFYITFCHFTVKLSSVGLVFFSQDPYAE